MSPLRLHFTRRGAGRAGLEHFEGEFDRRRLDASAAHRALSQPGAGDEHLRPGVLRRAAHGLDEHYEHRRHAVARSGKQGLVGRAVHGVPGFTRGLSYALG